MYTVNLLRSIWKLSYLNVFWHNMYVILQYDEHLLTIMYCILINVDCKIYSVFLQLLYVVLWYSYLLYIYGICLEICCQCFYRFFTVSFFYSVEVWGQVWAFFHIWQQIPALPGSHCLSVWFVTLCLFVFRCQCFSTGVFVLNYVGSRLHSILI